MFVFNKLACFNIYIICISLLSLWLLVSLVVIHDSTWLCTTNTEEKRVSIFISTITSPDKRWRHTLFRGAWWSAEELLHSGDFPCLLVGFLLLKFGEWPQRRESWCLRCRSLGLWLGLGLGLGLELGLGAMTNGVGCFLLSLQPGTRDKDHSTTSVLSKGESFYTFTEIKHKPATLYCRKGVSAGAKGLTSQPRPSRPGSVSAEPSGTPPSSTWSTGRATPRYHNNRIPFCKAGPTGPHVSLAVDSWCESLKGSEKMIICKKKCLFAQVCTSLNLKLLKCLHLVYIKKTLFSAGSQPNANIPICYWVVVYHKVCLTYYNPD